MKSCRNRVFGIVLQGIGTSFSGKNTARRRESGPLFVKYLNEEASRTDMNNYGWPKYIKRIRLGCANNCNF